MNSILYGNNYDDDQDDQYDKFGIPFPSTTYKYNTTWHSTYADHTNYDKCDYFNQQALEKKRLDDMAYGLMCFAPH